MLSPTAPAFAAGPLMPTKMSTSFAPTVSTETCLVEPSLNVAVTSPYMHNGVFKTLFQVLAFYNTRDVARWPAPEVGQNVNREELGTLRLTNQELEDVVAFLQTLTDGWRPASSR